jgi:replication fork protection complex subunit Csm3/Swi3
MASATPAAYDIPSGDELDDILNGIIDGEDVFDTSNIRPQSGAQENTTSAANASLGIDEEIKVVKKRQPIPKLDEDRSVKTPGKQGDSVC